MDDREKTAVEKIALDVAKLIDKKDKRIAELETELYETKTYRNELQDCLKDDRCSYYSLCRFLTKHNKTLLQSYFAEIEQEEEESERDKEEL